jgi:amidase
VARGPTADPWDPLAVEGPMARDVADCALLLDAMAGVAPTDPLALPAPETPFLAAAVRRFEDVGVAVDDACPDFSGAPDMFHALRAEAFVSTLGPLLEPHRDRLKPEIVWNIERGLAQTQGALSTAKRGRAALAARVAAFFETYDLLACPTTVVPPFPVEQRYVEAVGGHAFDTYVDWLGITYTLTLTGCPVISIPCGTTAAGLPVGLQLMAPPRAEAALFSFAALLEGLLGMPAGPVTPRTDGDG